MDTKRPKGRAAPPPLPRSATAEERAKAETVLAFAIAAVHVLEEQFGFTREQAQRWFELATDRAHADADKPVRPLW